MFLTIVIKLDNQLTKSNLIIFIHYLIQFNFKSYKPKPEDIPKISNVKSFHDNILSNQRGFTVHLVFPFLFAILQARERLDLDLSTEGVLSFGF